MDNHEDTKYNKKVLGKGLNALFGHTIKIDRNDQHSIIHELDPKTIKINPLQPRKLFNEERLEELATSIKEQGIIQPLTVRKLADDTYELISGERRLRASIMLNIKTVPVYIKNASENNILEIALVENIQREDLNPIEIALSYKKLIQKTELKQNELAKKVGKKRSTINNYLRLLKLPAEIQTALKQNKISMGHAKAIINIENEDLQLKILEKILEDGISVRKVEDIVATENNKNKKTKNDCVTKNFSSFYKNNFQNQFFSKIKINFNTKQKGFIKIPFNSNDELDNISKKLLQAYDKD